ncbi:MULTISPECIES: efflux RND transporter periplasmic adaptor subunit [Bradyrhizobium]|jgi:Cu(I)/Ag(I) efflux system membrane fusion protein|uniref:Membrane fusion protein, Cu(I)/Ag(I) efflux system n=2 Tax=Bradyrhizobium TaxID=374 RepID=A0ABY0PZX0_9BRAD|nr:MULTISPECIES: efflux RND transporter periplasmic adaptor subunit [Bradyrhizobium]SDJ24875.1 membrane fusion protein, Cu(I)/Ag(I) efflux system [Bradyrhizobium ottawaense]SEC77193.1 membrane fusion protein, Cu(I)/Ag(I) efflux system [Bradyrhizobium lablabi]SHK89117.1 membrane fusion protein, Cu(I)/Ag(I) efflux system [Bradyrhizobium lablabi]
MNRAVLACAGVALIAAAGAGLVATGAGRSPARADVTSAAAEANQPPIYYQDPDGKPDYSPVPKKTPDGRDYRPVSADDDVRVDKTPAASVAGGGNGGNRKIKYYRNPMGLPDTSPVPKKDSMGMDYIAVFDGDEPDDDTVKLSPGKIQRTGVKSEPAVRRAIRSVIRAPGTIQLDERRVSVIAMRSESFVLNVANVTTGSHVAKGQRLMEIYSPAISSAAAEYIATISSKTTAGDGLYGRGSRQRLINLDMPDAAIAAIEKTRNVPTSVEWDSPRDGIVLERGAIEGMRVQPGGVLFRIADHTVVWALIDIAERDLGAIRLGQSATVRARSFPGREFTGRIEVVYPEINKETRTARLRVVLPNPEELLLHDMYVDAEITIGSSAAVLTVPESAVMDTGSRQAVFVDKGQGRLEPRDVKLGQRGDGYVEIREGVAEGEPVVVSANFLVDAESNLKAALKGFSEGSKP